MKKNRESNIELLRIVAMLLIVLVHLLGKTSAINDVGRNSVIYYPMWFLYGICGMGNNVLIIVSGYFWNKTRFKLNKIVELWFRVFFYSVTLTLAARYILKIELVSGLKQACFPLINSEYWFFTAYVGLYFLTPYLKCLIENLNRIEFKKLLLILTGLFSLIPTLFGCNSWLNDGGSLGIVWFIYLYLIGAYIQRYRFEKKNIFWIKVMISMLLIAPSAKVILEITKLDNMFGRNIEMLFSSNSIFCVIASVAIFYFFLNIDIKKDKVRKIAEYLGQGCFGVYLIHNNRNIAHYIWRKLDAYYWVVERNNLFVMILICVFVFVVCNIVEHIRAYAFAKLYVNKYMDKMCIWLVDKSRKIITEEER